MDAAKFKVFQADILTQALDNSYYFDRLYDLYTEVAINSSTYQVISYLFRISQKSYSQIDEEIISHQINSSSINNHYTPAKVTQMQKLIYCLPGINIFEKTIPLHVLYSSDHSYHYTMLTGLVDKRFRILSVEINGTTIMNTEINHPSDFINGLCDAKVYYGNVYIEPEAVCNLYNLITCVIRGSNNIQKYRISKDTKSVFCKIRYFIKNLSSVSINRYQDMIREKHIMHDNCSDKCDSPFFECMTSGMSEYDIKSTGFTAKKDCNIYKLIQDRKKKGLPISYDCTKQCCYKGSPSKP